MTFLERYQKAEFWYEKVILIEIYHLARTQQFPLWTIAMTAQDFQISIGLVSENLRIAKTMHQDESLINCKTRVDALKRIGG
jgi:hypothetical protein